MKQVTQNYHTGELKVEEVPCPALRPGGLLVQNHFSLISAGTERTKVEMAQKSLLGKARSRPDQVKKVIEKIRTEGLLNACRAVMNQLSAPIPLGYSSAGVALEIADDVEGIRVGDRVACSGGGYANHAEVIFVPRNLCVKCPDGVPLDWACFATVGAIAMQGVRQAGVALGEKVAVIGLGLIGQIAWRLLEAAGCQVLGIDIDERMVELAHRSRLAHAINSATTPVLPYVEQWTGGCGVDAVLICAGTSSSEPVQLAGEIAREKGVVVALGGVGLDVPRELYYMKELDLRLSRSYGPGRYDPNYEEKGHDYPYAYVRWTEQRNMESFLELCAEKRLDLAPFLTHRFALDRAKEAYDLLAAKGGEPSLGIILTYDQSPIERRPIAIRPRGPREKQGRLGIGFIGAGRYAERFLLPALAQRDDVRLRAITTLSGLSARTAAERSSFELCLDDPDAILSDGEIEVVFVTTRHDTHARYVIEALRHGKHVYVEKPLCLSATELAEIESAYAHSDRLLMVGFNRRFSPSARDAKAALADAGPPMIVCRINAGPLPPEHWARDPDQGGRVIGEGCHFFDLVQFLAGSRPVTVYAAAVASAASARTNDNVTATVHFENGSVATIVYTGAGDSSLPKERIEVFASGCAAVLDDFRSVSIHRGGRHKRIRYHSQDKGQREEIARWIAAVRSGGPSPIGWDELRWAARANLAAIESLTTGRPVQIPDAAV
jgi:predicted dehydrogenase/threonine dehydrogenase-like Zn-dependent dehydrogenase